MGSSQGYQQAAFFCQWCNIATSDKKISTVDDYQGLKAD
jgi:hypothetical protein